MAQPPNYHVGKDTVLSDFLACCVIRTSATDKPEGNLRDMKFSGGRRFKLTAITGAAVLSACLLASAAAGTTPARASATTCIQVSTNGSSVCTAVDGSGTYVAHVQSQYITPGGACNTSAFFYYVPPG